MPHAMKIGVFDSGVGGMSVVTAIQQAMPSVEVVYGSDPQHIPYGNKPPDVVLGFVLPILQRLIDEGCAVLVIACNTVTTQHAPVLRQHFKVPIVGIEPMIKPAVGLTRSGVIAVCATSATLASKRYAWLKQQYAPAVKIIEPDCSQWALMIERGRADQLRLDSMVDALITQGVDVIVLACTHYHWIQEQIEWAAAGRAQILQPEQAVIVRLGQVMKEI